MQSTPFGDAAALPGLQGLHALQGLPGLLRLQGLPGLPGLPGRPGLRGLPWPGNGENHLIFTNSHENPPILVEFH